MSREDIRTALTEVGPMTCVELSKFLGIGISAIKDSVSRWRKSSVREIYVSRWETPAEREGRTSGRLSAVWAVGNRSDALKPPRTPKKEQNRLYKQRHRDLLKARKTGRVATPFDALLRA